MPLLDHSILRAMPTCPECKQPKDQGILLCWPCFRFMKRDPGLTSRLDELEKQEMADAE